MKKIFTIILILFFLFLSTSFVLAADPLEDNLKAIGQGADYSTNVGEETIPSFIGQMVAIILGFIGSIFFIIVVYSGIQWMTAGGNEEVVKKSRTRLINSIIGLAITTAAYFITQLISRAFI
ncbi:hypothetical protein KKF32_03680 [Patescibacteria group bacterium]|nr:hypothetical protein [Patescibacteria group bacterium]